MIKVKNGRIAQSVEQRIENPRVPGSIPGSATTFYTYVTLFPYFITKELPRIELGSDSIAQHILMLRCMESKSVSTSNFFPDKVSLGSSHCFIYYLNALKLKNEKLI